MAGNFEKFENVCGKDGRTNTVLHKSSSKSTSMSHVIYFPGDLQNYESIMMNEDSTLIFSEFCFENILELLSKHFHESHIWLIVPNKYIYNRICVYKNFIQNSSIVGTPTHSQELDGLEHLVTLFHSLIERLASSSVDVATDISLIGFSKGCIVLNQILYEVSALSETSSISEYLVSFVKRIKSIVWLDGGHNGESEVWVNNTDVVNKLELLRHVHFIIFTSPYQTKDSIRPWKGEMKTKFVDLLSTNGFNVEDQNLFEDKEPSIEDHFSILKLFLC